MVVDPENAATAYALIKGTGLAHDWLQRIGGGSVDELGTALKQYTRAKLERLSSVSQVAKAMVDAAGKEGGPVSPKILDPLLEGAAREDDPELAQAWSALLANAVIGDPTREVLPRFPHILQQIAPAEAHLLDYLFEHHEDAQPVPPDGTSRSLVWQEWFGTPEELAVLLDADDATVSLLWANLAGLGLVRGEPNTRRAAEIDEEGQRLEANSIMFTDGTAVRLTELGWRFVKACRPPRPSEPGSDPSA